MTIANSPTKTQDPILVVAKALARSLRPTMEDAAEDAIDALHDSGYVRIAIDGLEAALQLASNAAASAESDETRKLAGFIFDALKEAGEKTGLWRVATREIPA